MPLRYSFTSTTSHNELLPNWRLSRGATEQMSQKVFLGHSDGVDLVLGIVPTGASYLLMPELQFQYTFGRANVRPWPSNRFQSLSPIHFATASELDKKLSTLSSKKSGNGPPRDRSKANTRYCADGSDRQTPVGIARVSFEHQRVLVRLLRQQLDHRVYALHPAPWVNEIRILSLAFNVWKMDKRERSEREKSPRLLDIGWTEYGLISPNGGLSPRSTTHITLNDNRMLNTPGTKRQDCTHGLTEHLERAVLVARLKDVFSSGKRTILLVHDENKTSKLLAAFNVPVSSWKSGVVDVLYNNATSGAFNRSQTSSRSQSPTRSDRSGIPRRPASPTMRSDSACIVDVRLLYQTLKQVSTLIDSINSNARDLLLEVPLIGKDGREEPLCAGNESWLLGKMWYSMACGPAIDEQKVMRWPSQPTLGSSPAPEANFSSMAPDEDDEDDEADPNDLPPQTSATIAKSVPLMDADGGDDSWDDSD